MRYRLGLCLAAAMLLAGAKAPDLPMPSKAAISKYAKNKEGSTKGEPLAGWERALKNALLKQTPEQAADQLAPNFGMPAPLMRELVRLWLVAKVDTDIGDDKAQVAFFRKRVLALLDGSGRTELALEAATVMIGDVRFADLAQMMSSLTGCSAEDFDALMAGSQDKVHDAWIVARTADCDAWASRFVALAPDRAAAALLRISFNTSLKPGYSLPLAAWFLDKGMAHVEAADRPGLMSRLNRRYASILFSAGLSDRALALLEGLPEPLRTETLNAKLSPAMVRVDGLAVYLDGDPDTDTLKFELASAYAIRGRTREADTLFKSIEGVSAARKAFECSQHALREKARADCADRHDVDLGPLMLDHLLHDPNGDPYPLAEAMFGAGISDRTTPGIVAELRCRVFAEPQYIDICTDARRSTADWASDAMQSYERDQVADALALVDKAAPADLAAQRPGFARALAESIERNGGAVPPRDYARVTVDPAPSPFVQAPLPVAYRKKHDDARGWPKGYAALPGGHQPVRFDQRGSRVVAISLSQDLDPTGEVSSGGYWVHVSDDGGRNWQTPLYTGLAENFPYVVTPGSAMPLLDGDTLNIEVEIAELDTASITYPPVALRTRRREQNLYLRMPLAELVRDSNGDGLSDIASHRLLLDNAPVSGGTPFVLGSEAVGRCTKPPTVDQFATIALFREILRMPSRAIVESVDRPTEQLVGPWRKATASAGRPVFIEGNPRDYACLRPDRPTIVYGEADMERLKRFSPDFHGISMPRIVFNRAHDRGYAKWSTGWAGGTFRLKLVNGNWAFDTISGWIT